eukprot:GHVR01035119.1.p1 GENE.GHVR01035119.1~~GHVR01035119.1.p1  ORF type:complete len:472 (-),score=106.13 GHVR01035119.1:35-1450(-)
MNNKLLLILSTILSIGYCNESNVLETNDKDLESLLYSYDRLLLTFYAPWCGHCHALMPELDKASVKAKEKGLKTAFVKIDATTSPESASEYEVTGYPTLVYFVKGQKKEYDGPRVEDGILEWIEKREKPNYVVLASEEVDAFVSLNPFTFLCRARKGTKKVSLFKQVAEELTSRQEGLALVYVSTDAEAVSELYRRDFDDSTDDPKVVKYSGKINKDSVVKFIDGHKYMTLGKDIDPELYLYQSETSTCILTTADPSLADDLMKDTSRKYKDTFKCTATEYSANMDKLKVVGMSGNDQLLLLHRASASGQVEKYFLSNATDKKAIQEFFNDWENKKLKRYFKSAPIDKEEEDGVKVLVADNFEEVVYDANKDVLVEYYAPWCGHCKQLAPIYSELAKKMQKYKNVVIAKMDAIENDVRDQVQGFPTLMFYPAGESSKKNVNKMLFKGERTLEGMGDFVEFYMESPDSKDEL